MEMDTTLLALEAWWYGEAIKYISNLSLYQNSDKQDWNESYVSLSKNHG